MILTKGDYNVEMLKGGNFILWKKSLLIFLIFFQEPNQLKSMYYRNRNRNKFINEIRAPGGHIQLTIIIDAQQQYIKLNIHSEVSIIVVQAHSAGKEINIYIMTNWDKTAFLIESRGKRFKYLWLHNYNSNTSCI